MSTPAPDAVVTVHPVPPGLTPASHALAVLIALDILVNALCGGRAYQTISSRIGESLDSGGWAARMPWPAWFRRHCEASVYRALV